MNRGATPEQRAAMVAAYRAGASLRQAGAAVGLSHRAALTALEKAGVVRRPRWRRPRLSPDAAAALVARYVQGADLRRVAAEFGVAFGTARRAVAAAGVMRRHGGDRRSGRRP